MIHFQQPYATIEIEQDKDLLILTWHGFANSEEFRGTRNKALALARQYNVHHWISNMKDMKAIRQADQDWSVQEWLPQFLNLNIKKWAIIISDDMFNQMAMSSMMGKIRPQLTNPVEYFQDLNTAKNWVERP